VTEAGIVERVAETRRVEPSMAVERPPFPTKLKIEVTGRCDLRCSFCTLTYKPRSAKGDIEPALAFRVIREARDLGVRDLGLFWLGEPLLNARLTEYVAYAKAIGTPYVFITTNGRLASTTRLRDLYDAGIDSIKFSVNAVDAQEYRRVTAVDAFDRVISNVRGAWELRGARAQPKLYASTVVLDEPDGERRFEAAHRLIGAYVDQHYALRQYGIQAAAKHRAAVLLAMLPCWSLFTEPHISYTGWMSACFYDHDPKYYLGDLTVSTLIAAWHSERAAALRRAHLAKDVAGTPCADCLAYAHA